MILYTIECKVTDAENAAITEMATALTVTNKQFFQRFWDVYMVDGKEITGAIKAQINQWIKDKLKTKIEQGDPAEILAQIK